MKQNPTTTIISLAVIICGFAAIFGLSGFIEKNRPALPENYADEDLALQGARLKGFALGFEGLIADWYWMQALQYLGGKILKNPNAQISLDNLNSLNPRLLYPYLDNATTLDPQFIAAYSYGAVVLPAIDNEQAIKFLKKGIADNPNEWRLYQHLGYIYWRLGSFEKASEVYAAGAKIPDAPKFLQMMTAKVKAEGGSRETARSIYRQMFEEAEDEKIKETAALRLLQIDSLEEQDAIRAVLQNFQTATGRCANDWREIYPRLRMQKTSSGVSLRFDAATFAPLDPTKIPYVLNTESLKCDVNINYRDSKIPAY
jgi:tetratricopeptide (TPR) repeat protein